MKKQELITPSTIFTPPFALFSLIMYIWKEDQTSQRQYICTLKLCILIVFKFFKFC